MIVNLCYQSPLFIYPQFTAIVFRNGHDHTVLNHNPRVYGIPPPLVLPDCQCNVKLSKPFPCDTCRMTFCKSCQGKKHFCIGKLDLPRGVPLSSSSAGTISTGTGTVPGDGGQRGPGRMVRRESDGRRNTLWELGSAIGDDWEALFEKVKCVVPCWGEVLSKAVLRWSFERVPQWGENGADFDFGTSNASNTVHRITRNLVSCMLTRWVTRIISPRGSKTGNPPYTFNVETPQGSFPYLMYEVTYSTCKIFVRYRTLFILERNVFSGTGHLQHPEALYPIKFNRRKNSTNHGFAYTRGIFATE